MQTRKSGHRTAGIETPRTVAAGRVPLIPIRGTVRGVAGRLSGPRIGTRHQESELTLAGGVLETPTSARGGTEQSMAFEKGDVVNGGMAIGNKVGVPLSGVVNLRAMTPEGHVLAIGTLIAPALLDFEGLAATEQLAIQVVAKNDCEVAVGSRAGLEKRLEADPQAIVPLLESQIELLRAVQLVARTCVISRLAPRVAAALLNAAGDGSREVRVSHQEIAETVGSSRPSVPRLLLRMKRASLIDTGRRAIQLCDVKALEGAVC